MTTVKVLECKSGSIFLLHYLFLSVHDIQTCSGLVYANTAEGVGLVVGSVVSRNGADGRWGSELHGVDSLVGRVDVVVVAVDCDGADVVDGVYVLLHTRTHTLLLERDGVKEVSVVALYGVFCLLGRESLDGLAVNLQILQRAVIDEAKLVKVELVVL